MNLRHAGCERSRERSTDVHLLDEETLLSESANTHQCQDALIKREQTPITDRVSLGSRLLAYWYREAVWEKATAMHRGHGVLLADQRLLTLLATNSHSPHIPRAEDKGE